MSILAWWHSAVTFFESQSALANFLQIGGVCLAVALAAWRSLRSLSRRLREERITSICVWLSGRKYGPISAKALKIVVVDDRAEDYPLDVLRRLGYSVTHIGHLSLADIPSLRTYDCILLDINGVLDEDLKRGGVEIIRRLKSEEGPYIIAVSSRGFDITLSEFFMLADHRLKKPIPVADVEGIIQRAFVAKYSAEHAAHRIDDAAAHWTPQSRATRKALKLAIKYLESAVVVDEVRKALSLVMSGERLSNIVDDLNVIRRSIMRPS